MKKAGDFLKGFFDNLGISSEKTKTIYSCWNEIAGKEIADNSSIVDIKKEIVFVEVSHPGWIQIINLKKDLLLKNINDKFPEKEIKEIKVFLKKQST
jgi:predicted nucleic acid-binding Zn ribbon protein